MSFNELASFNTAVRVGESIAAKAAKASLVGAQTVKDPALNFLKFLKVHVCHQIKENYRDHSSIPSPERVSAKPALVIKSTNVVNPFSFKTEGIFP